MCAISYQHNNAMVNVTLRVVESTRAILWQATLGLCRIFDQWFKYPDGLNIRLFFSGSNIQRKENAASA